MKSSPLAAARPLRLTIIVAALLIYSGMIRELSVTHAAIDPTLNLSLTRTNQNVILSWFGANAVPYQLESSSNLVTWVNSGAVITGSNVFNFITNPIAVQGRRFYRVNRLFPAANGTAAFNPATGLLTIVGDDSDNTITVGLNGNLIVVNGGAMPITGGVPATTNTMLIQVLGRAGNDQIAIAGGLPPAHLFGDIGNDTLLGGSAADVLVGGPGNDFLDGNQGSDIAYLGEGDDTFQWDPGDGNDIVEGQSGNDTLLFNGSNVSEIVDLSAIGSRFRFFRNVGNVTLDVDGIERVDFQALGGADNVVVNDLTGTAVTQVNVNLASFLGGNTGDAQVDLVTINGTVGADIINIATNAGAMEITGLAAQVRVVNAEATNDVIVVNGAGGDLVNVNGSAAADLMTLLPSPTAGYARAISSGYMASVDVIGALTLSLNGLGGPDTITGSGNVAGLGIPIQMDGGDGNDTILGSNASELLVGGAGNDFIDGNQGSDTALLGDDNDTFQWDPGDGNDMVEGQGGSDTLLFNGANIAEIFDVSANGARVRFTRNIGTVTMDLDDVETLDLNALGGADILTVNDLTGTDLTNIIADLAATGGGGDGQADTVIINGTSADDIITATLPGGDLLVTGLAASVVVDGFETTIDTVRIQGLAGDDILDASAVGAGSPVLVLDGGTGNDILQGGAGNDNLTGGDNDDVLLGNGGTDVLDGGTGENILIQDGSNVTTGIVSVFGDGLDNTITISRDAGGNILSNGVPIPGATVANTALIRVFGQDGDDIITFDEANGALPAAALYGGPGLDTLTGGSGADLIFGGINNDTLLGKGGFDLLFGGAGNDTLTGGDADDQAFGEGDNDRFIWNPGDDTDLNEGGGGVDIVEVNGGNGAEVFTTTANGTRVRFDRVSPAPFALDIGTCENLVLNANGGDDSFSATGNLAALIQITVDGGAGNDTLLGSNGADLLLGGDGNDFIDGNQGNDTVFLGAGDDTFQWDPGDGNDTVEGQADNDTLLFNGSNIGEIFDLSANGTRVRFTRNIGTVTMDLDDIENLNLNALGGTDTLTVNNLAGTDLTSINADLAATLGGNTGDAVSDTVIVNGTASPDTINIVANAGAVEVSGLAAQVRITHSEAANDALIVNGLGGTDIFSLGPGVTTLIGVTLNQ